MNERGVALPTAMIAMAILMSLIVVLMTLATSEPQIANNQVASAQARAMAESGLERAIWALTMGDTDPNVAGALADPLPNPVPAPYNGVQFIGLSAQGGFKVQVTDGPGAGERTVVATGFTPNSAAPVATKKIQAVVLPGGLRLADPKNAPVCAVCAGAETPTGANTKLLLNNTTILADPDQQVGSNPRPRFCGGGPTPQGAYLSTGTANATGNTQSTDPHGQPGSRGEVAKSVFSPFTLTDADVAAIRAIAKANGTYFQGAKTFTAANPPPNGIVFVDTTTGNPFTNDTPDSQAGSVDLSGAITWSGWLIVAGTIHIPSGDPRLTGMIYAQNDLTVNTEATITGAVITTNRKDAVSNNVDSQEKKATVIYDCPSISNPGGLNLIPQTPSWTIKGGTYREVSG